jgi:uncharacterized protein (TIGR02266 family)
MADNSKKPPPLPPSVSATTQPTAERRALPIPRPDAAPKAAALGSAVMPKSPAGAVAASTNAQIQSREDSALKRLTGRLEQLDATTLEAPSVDPRTAAIAALMVANFVGREEAKERFATLIRAKLLDADAIDDLPVAARFILRILPKLGPEQGLGLANVPDLLLEVCRARREDLLRLTERHLSDIDEAHGRIATIKLGSGLADLVQDLRLLADLCRDYAEPLEKESAGFDPTWSSDARLLAMELEVAIVGPLTDEEREWRAYLLKAWAMLITAYDEVCRAGRFLFFSDKPEARFPSLAAVTRVRRRIKRETARREGSLPPSSMPRPSRHGRENHSIPPEVSLVELPEETSTSSRPLVDVRPPSNASTPIEAPTPPQDEATLALSSSDASVAFAPSSPSPFKAFDLVEAPVELVNRASHARIGVELEVTYASESNFYTGLADGPSEVGLFVATYVVKPQGSRFSISLSLPDTDEPLMVKGVVRWVREFSPYIETPPGMGVSLQDVSAPDRARLDAFMRIRTPFFHDD